MHHRKARAFARPKGKPKDGRRLVGENIHRLRKEQSLTQEALAEIAGLHWTYVGSVERQERNVSIDNICRLAWALRVEPRDLLAPIHRS